MLPLFLGLSTPTMPHSRKEREREREPDCWSLSVHLSTQHSNHLQDVGASENRGYLIGVLIIRESYYVWSMLRVPYLRIPPRAMGFCASRHLPRLPWPVVAAEASRLAIRQAIPQSKNL